MWFGSCVVDGESHCGCALIVKIPLTTMWGAMEGTTGNLDVTRLAQTGSHRLTMLGKKTPNPSTSLHIVHPSSRLYNQPPLFRLHSSLRPVIRFALHTHPLRDKPNSEASSPLLHPHSQSVHDVKSPNPSVDVKQVYKHVDQQKQALSSQDLSKANLRT